MKFYDEKLVLLVARNKLTLFKLRIFGFVNLSFHRRKLKYLRKKKFTKIADKFSCLVD